MSTQGTESRQAEGARSETERAEKVMEDLGERVGDWVSRAAARAREQVEDIWADAQAVRHGDGRQDA